MADTARPRINFSKILNSPDILVAVAIVTIVIMFILPLPVFFLDFFMSISLALSLFVLFLVIFSTNPLDISIFPSMLLIMTLLRLGLNVSSTRLILSKGPQFNGKLITAFGQFVVGGNFIVGLIIFIILIAVQYIVISKGTTRMSEVAARFALDSLPGKQMMIDSDLAAGIITEQEAILRRKSLQREADFYGSMDGASKFVSGDVMVGIFITVVNIIGGILIGLLKFHMDFTQAMETFLIFTVGDGLVSQIPSLLNGVSAGIIVSRSEAADTLGNEFKKEATRSYYPLWILAATLTFFGFVPGFPWYVFLPLGGLFGYLAYSMQTSTKKKVEEKIEKKEEEKPVIIDKLVPIEPIALEIGYSLIPLVDKSQGGDLFERIANVRKQIAYDYGMIVPPIVVRDSLKLEATEYSIKIHGVKVASSKLYPDRLLAINPGVVSEEIEGIKIKEPTYNLDAVWIEPSQKDIAESFGYTVINCSTVIATHLTETIMNNVDSLLGREEVKKIIDSIRDEYKTLVSEVESVTNIGFLQKVFQNLLSEKISIRNIATILQTVADKLEINKNLDPDLVSEFVREKLKNQICRTYTDDKGRLRVYALSPKLENYLANEFEKSVRLGVYTFPPQFLPNFINKILEFEKEANEKKLDYFILLVSPRIRRQLKMILSSVAPRAVVLSTSEISPGVSLEYVGQISMGDQ
ncbi:MAG: flagellar biosynthesis protein FlhA [Spirochaetes bacterium]|nr:flagellar biosynthesis protein FlhA [Spirochaetota bacterium]NLJ05116.1 flagellar biosynthesis protein FlhA [Exilispira sp.]HOV46374.1 flagellar biosynthesis protein FlhA [Exilispira sp.]